MSKYILTAIVSFLFFEHYSQQLSVSETLKYINEKTMSHQFVAVNQKGDLYWINMYSRDLWDDPNKYDKWVNRINNKKFHINSTDLEDIKSTSMIKSDIRNLKFSTYAYSQNYNSIFVKCETGRCITLTDFRSIRRDKNSFSESEFFLNKLDDENNKKLLRALEYLQSLIVDDEKYNANDYDPFSNKNFISSTASSNNISLKNENGVYKLTVLIYNLPFEFILDSGASEISISRATELLLINKNLIEREDYLEPGLYRIADGTIIISRRVLIKNMKIGNIEIKNVIASIGDKNSPQLLGRNFLDKFKSWKINNDQNNLELETN